MKHFVTGKSLFDEYPDGSCQIIFGAGCFWGVERVFWQLDGVWTTYVSYSRVRNIGSPYTIKLPKHSFYTPKTSRTKNYLARSIWIFIKKAFSRNKMLHISI